MAALAHVTDHADQAIARLLEQYRAGVTMPALVRALARQVQEIEDALWDVLILRRLNNASGAQLDVIGRIVGQPREARSDATYLLWLRARMLINLGSGRPEDILAVFASVMQGSTTLQLEEQFPAAFVLRIGSAAVVDPVHAAAILNLAKAGGVRAILESATSIDTTSFAMDPNGAGFGTATAATDSTAALGVGATTLLVASSAGFAAADAIVVEPGANEETRIVQSVAAGQIVVTVALAKAHAAGVEIRNTPNTGGTMAAAF